MSRSPPLYKRDSLRPYCAPNAMKAIHRIEGELKALVARRPRQLDTKQQQRAAAAALEIRRLVALIASLYE